MRTLRKTGTVFALIGVTAAIAGASAGPASAATISPTYWDFGAVGLGATSAPKTFVTTGEAGDNFTGHTSLLGYDPDFFKIVSDDCTGKLINGPEDSCSVTVAFSWTDESVEGDFSAILDTKPYTGTPQFHADLVGHSAGQGEEGGGGKRGGGGTLTKKKCKKIKNKAKRKKCLKKLQQQGGTGRRR